MEDTKLKLTLCLNACLSVFVITLVNLLFLFHLLAFLFILIEKKKKRVLSPPSTVDHGYCPNVSIVVCGGGVVPPPVVSGDTVPPPTLLLPPFAAFVVTAVAVMELFIFLLL
jgi:hypothetical protein